MNQPVTREIKQVSGYKDIAELRDAMPADADAPEPGTKLGPSKEAAKPRKPRARPAPTPVADPFKDDKRYQEACAEMAAFGGKDLIVRGFEGGAKLLEDEKFKLSAKEERSWDNFFYVLSKKPLFDVGHPVFLALFFLITLAAQLGWRVFERSEMPFIKELFHRRGERQDEPPTPSGKRFP